MQRPPEVEMRATPTATPAARILAVATLAVAASLALTAAAGAQINYTVTLTNGTTFETRYEPVEVEWDDSILIVMTDVGNQIALQKSDVADVVSVAEARGYGYRLDTTTLFLGWSPNDLLTIDEEGNEVPTYDTSEPPPAPPDFTVNQFVDAPVVGSGSTGGVPVTEIGIVVTDGL